MRCRAHGAREPTPSPRERPRRPPAAPRARRATAFRELRCLHSVTTPPRAAACPRRPRPSNFQACSGRPARRRLGSTPARISSEPACQLTASRSSSMRRGGAATPPGSFGPARRCRRAVSLRSLQLPRPAPWVRTAYAAACAAACAAARGARTQLGGGWVAARPRRGAAAGVLRAPTMAARQSADTAPLACAPSRPLRNLRARRYDAFVLRLWTRGPPLPSKRAGASRARRAARQDQHRKKHEDGLPGCLLPLRRPG